MCGCCPCVGAEGAAHVWWLGVLLICGGWGCCEARWAGTKSYDVLGVWLLYQGHGAGVGGCRW